MALGSKLKKYRIQKKQSLQKVADSVGASKAHIWELEKGTSSNPSMGLLKKLADHFDISIASLVGEDPSAPDENPELVTMFRDLKKLNEHDRETIHLLMKGFKSRKKE